MRTILNNNKKGGIVTTTILGVGALIIGVIITLVIVTTLNDAQLVTANLTNTVTGRTGAFINITPYTVSEASTTVGFGTFTVTNAINYTNGSTIDPSFYTVDASAGTIVNATNDNWDNVSINFTYQETTNDQKTINNLRGNLSGGVDNVAIRVPTILLIVAVVFLFGALALLLRQSSLMGIGSSGGSAGGSL